MINNFRMINDCMKVNEKAPDTIENCYSALYSDDNNEWIPCDHSTSSLEEAREWYESFKKDHPYAELTLQVVGIWNGGDEVETLGEVLVEKYNEIILKGSLDS